MTPREVQLSIKAASERRLDHYDELVAAAWQGALWARVDAKRFPKIEKVLTRRHQRRRPMTAEEDIARWERFFRSSDRQRGGRAN
jgi:hypothetical protein